MIAHEAARNVPLYIGVPLALMCLSVVVFIVAVIVFMWREF